MRSSLLRPAGYLALVFAASMSSGIGFGAHAVASTTQPSAPKSDSTFLFTNPMTVTTSTGKSLTVETHALTTTYQGTDIGTSFTVSFSRPMIEEHDWSFEGTPGTLNANAQKGSGTFDTGSQMDDFGSLSLTITSAGAAKTTKCGSNTTTTHPVKVSGSFDFVTGSTGSNAWGSIDKTLTFKGILSTSTDGSVTNTCPSNNYCPTAGISYIGIPETGAPGLIGEPDGSKNLLTVSQTTELSTPTGASRSDYVFADADVSAAKDGSGDKLTIKPTGSGPVTGSGYFTQASKPKTSHCKSIVSESFDKAAFTSKSLAGHPQIFGPLTVGSFSKSASFEIDKK